SPPSHPSIVFRGDQFRYSRKAHGLSSSIPLSQTHMLVCGFGSATSFGRDVWPSVMKGSNFARGSRPDKPMRERGKNAQLCTSLQDFAQVDGKKCSPWQSARGFIVGS